MDFSLQNTMNRAAGQSFEELITESLAYYYEKGYASIEKTPEPMRVLKQNADHTFTAVYTKKHNRITKGFFLEDKQLFLRQSLLRMTGSGKRR